MKPFWWISVVVAVVVSVVGSSAQSARLQMLMQHKREYARELLTAVTLGDWTDLERLGGGLLQIAEDPAWAPLKSPEYAEYSAAFLSATQSLLTAARRRDTVAAPLAYASLTMSCVQCHQARTRMAVTPEVGTVVRPRRPAWVRHRSRGHTEARQDPHLQPPPEGKNTDENEPIHD